MIAFYHSFIKINRHFNFINLFYFFIYVLEKNVQNNSLPNRIRIMLLDIPLPCHSHMYSRLIIMKAFYHSFIKIDRHFYFIILFYFFTYLWGIMPKAIVCPHHHSNAIRKTISLSFYMYCRLIIMIAFYHSFIKINRHFLFLYFVIFLYIFWGKMSKASIST